MTFKFFRVDVGFIPQMSARKVSSVSAAALRSQFTAVTLCRAERHDVELAAESIVESIGNPATCEIRSLIRLGETG